MTYQKRLAEYADEQDPDFVGEQSVLVPEVVKEFPTKDITQGTVYTFNKKRNTRLNHPMHKIHPYPARYIPEIPRWAIKYAALRDQMVVLDPFAGCGTTLLEAILSNKRALGVEMNPLGRLITKVKTTPLETSDSEAGSLVDKLMRRIRNDKITIDLDDPEQSDINLHENWRFWFTDKKMEGLIRIKRNIIDLLEDHSDLRDLMLVCLSSIVKPVSFLNEKQIKVRKDPEKVAKGTPDPIVLFSTSSKQRLSALIDLTRRLSNSLPETPLIGIDARKLEIDSESVDFVVTSPPYLNAIDYPFAHKYELFILDLVLPREYRPHSRSYIGVSERVLLKKTYGSKKHFDHEKINKLIDEIYSDDSSVDQKRAHIIYQYFSGMRKVMAELHRVLRDDRLAILVVGETNVIRGRGVQTAELLEEISLEQGFTKELHFFHRLHSRKLAPNRHNTGGLVKDERVSILKKN